MACRSYRSCGILCSSWSVEERTEECILPYLMHLSHYRATDCYLQCDWEWCCKGGMALMRWCQIATFPADADRYSYCITGLLSTTRLWTLSVNYPSGCLYLVPFSYYPIVFNASIDVASTSCSYTQSIILCDSPVICRPIFALAAYALLFVAKWEDWGSMWPAYSILTVRRFCYANYGWSQKTLSFSLLSNEHERDGGRICYTACVRCSCRHSRNANGLKVRPRFIHRSAIQWNSIWNRWNQRDYVDGTLICLIFSNGIDYEVFFDKTMRILFNGAHYSIGERYYRNAENDYSIRRMYDEILVPFLNMRYYDSNKLSKKLIEDIIMASVSIPHLSGCASACAAYWIMYCY